MKRYGPGASRSPCCGICNPSFSPLVCGMPALGCGPPAVTRTASIVSSCFLLLCGLAGVILVAVAACAAVAAVAPFTPTNATVCCSGLGLGATKLPMQWACFEFDSTLGYPGEGPPTEALDEAQLPEAADLWLMQVEEETRLVEALPFVLGKVRFDYSDASANLNKVEVVVSCCWASSRLKRGKVACDETTKSTQLEALRALRLKLVDEHGRADHVHDPRAVARRAEVERDNEILPEAATALDRIRLAQALQQRTQARAAADEGLVAEARAAEEEATRACKAIEAQARESKAAALAAQGKYEAIGEQLQQMPTWQPVQLRRGKKPFDYYIPEAERTQAKRRRQRE
uniref:Uncharacterized protein n=1 Tax=Coccolithus braarudii TaxID=221442 RepID=A0A6T7HW18_9EUKA|mmetsp:Transcript_38826/g.82720  ORF Transcript_38826/g.82720 Transcript_38826/m.82720 type:complete len:345 (+) Transcript_38826:1-1035(+)